ncbi:MAG TPA: hypothetical protein PL166_02220 [Candidatus Contendobacter sp.]|nr:hypothetical protein [Candidatus Contendobacter sp.]
MIHLINHHHDHLSTGWNPATALTVPASAPVMHIRMSQLLQTALELTDFVTAYD